MSTFLRWCVRMMISVSVFAMSAGMVYITMKAFFPAVKDPIATTAHADAQHEPGTVHAEARVVTYPNASVVLGTEVGGRITALNLKEQDSVKEGDLVAEFDASEQRAALGEAGARAHAADVSIKFLRSEVQRSKELLDAKAVTGISLDKMRHELNSAVAQRGVAGAEYTRISAAVAKTKIKAPISGTIMERHAEPGETVAPGAKLYTIVDMSRIRIEAEVDEFDAPHIKVGMPVTVTAEGHATKWTGIVEDVPAAVTQRRLKPQDPSRPTDSRVLLVKVALEEMKALKLGQRVEVSIGTAERKP